MKGEVEFVHWLSQRWVCEQEVSPRIRMTSCMAENMLMYRPTRREHVEEMSIIQAVASRFSI